MMTKDIEGHIAFPPNIPSEIRLIDHGYHNKGLCPSFREQIAVLYPIGFMDRSHIKMMRDFVNVGLPGVSGFDQEQPGVDTAEGWAILDDLIENQGVRGIFHTHPPGISGFSGQDYVSQLGLAQANGSRLIWHVVQSLGDKESHVICLNMIAQQVFYYDLGRLRFDINDPVLLLPIPPRIRYNRGVFGISS